MARRTLNMAFFALIAIASVFHSSVAQTTLTVGGTAGWTVGSVNYASWAANQSFAAGDILLFNFANNQHDVAQVRKADYDACSTTNPIFAATTSPARITLNGTGEHYFICRFQGHCSGGQKLMINVSAATAPTPQPSSSPAPQPSTATPVSAPSPSPVSGQTAPSPSPATSQTPPAPAPSSSVSTYTVGDGQGWNLTSNTASFYQNWASNKTFNVGDVLVFNYTSGAHDVAEVTKANYDNCNTQNPISLSGTPPTRITLTAGEHYYVCAIPGHCVLGQKLAINVTTPSSPSPAGSTAPPSPDSSARSVSVVGLSATFLSIVVALFY